MMFDTFISDPSFNCSAQWQFKIIVGSGRDILNPSYLYWAKFDVNKIALWIWVEVPAAAGKDPAASKMVRQAQICCKPRHQQKKTDVDNKPGPRYTDAIDFVYLTAFTLPCI
jgi:hypothetical protein